MDEQIFSPLLQKKSPLSVLLVSNPIKFIAKISQNPNWLSEEAAEDYDKLDPLNFMPALFNKGTITPFAGHSLGPSFEPVNKRIAAINELQKNGLHSGHFPGNNPAGNWFDCDIDPLSIQAAKSIMGFSEDEEFVYSASGLSANLAMLMSTFYRPGLTDWKNGKTKITFLGSEFFSDQSIIYSLLQNEIDRANDFGCFTSSVPAAESQIIKLQPDESGLYTIRTDHFPSVSQMYK